MNTITCGKYAGVLITQVPVQYLIWMVSVNHSERHLAEKEIERRGTSLPTVSVSLHAIDRASLRFLNLYLKDRNKGEGIARWLCRIAEECLNPEKDKVEYKGMVLAYDLSLHIPALKTVVKR